MDYDHKNLSISNIINYLRKSRRDEEKEKRTGEDTLEDQRKLMTRVLDDLGIPYSQKFEIGSGDQIETRPVFQSIIEELKAGKYDAIAVKEISRLGRGSYTDMGIIYDLVSKRRIYIITPWKIYDPLNSADLRQIRFELFMSREEFETTRERMVGARYSSAMEGKWVSKVPFGYVRNPNTGRLTPHPEEAKIVNLIFDLFVNGLKEEDGTVRDIGTGIISNYLYKIGVKTPNGKKYWYPRTIDRLLTNTVYIGTVKFRTTETVDGKSKKRPEKEHIIVENAHEAIVDDILFYEAIKKINERESSLARIRMDYKHVELTGLMKCGECGKGMVSNRSKRKYKWKTTEQVSEYYDNFLRCSGMRCITIRYEPIEEKVRNLLAHFSKLDTDSINELIKKQIDDEKQRLPARQDMAEDIQRNIETRKKELDNRLNFIADKHFNGVYSDEDYLKFKKEIEDDLKALMEAESLSSEQVSAINHREMFIDPSDFRLAFSEICDIYDNLETPQEKNKLLSKIFKSIKLKVLEKGNNQKQAKVMLEPELTKYVIFNEVVQ